MYRSFFKRILDVLGALLALAFLWPILLLTALLVRIKLGSPVIFCQKRPGLHEQIFTLYKFRTMTDGRDEQGCLLPDDKRMTPFGRLLRSTSLDELPELFNILKGDMAIVGPRPLLIEYLPRYNTEQHHRHDVRPGLTGYAQVHGRNSLSWNEKFKMDVWYTQHVTCWLDAEIILQTILTVLMRKGISSGTSETMEKFYGTETGK